MFYPVIQMVKDLLVKKGISIATSHSLEQLARLKTTASKGKAPRPRCVPRQVPWPTDFIVGGGPVFDVA